MKDTHKRLFLEMAGIILLAVAVGITWNHRLLQDAYTGKLVSASTTPETDAMMPGRSSATTLST